MTKDGRIFDSNEFHSYAAVVFFTTGDLTTLGKGRQASDVGQGQTNAAGRRTGWNGICRRARSERHVSYTAGSEDRSNRYIAHGDQEDPYLRMLGAEFIIHGREPRLQDANLIVNDAKFPGLEGVTSQVSFNEEWYSMKDFVPDLHVILTLDTQGMKGECYQRAPYPVTWARMHGKGRVFLHRDGRPAGELEECLFRELARRRDSLEHWRCQRSTGCEPEASRARLRGNSSKISCGKVSAFQPPNPSRGMTETGTIIWGSAG